MRKQVAASVVALLASVAAAAPPARTAPARRLAPHAGRVFGMAFAPDGASLVTASGDETVRVYAIPSGELLLTLPGHAGGAGDVVLSPDGRRLAVSCYGGTVRIWSLPEGRAVGTGRGPEGTGHTLAVSPDGARLAVGSQDGTIQLLRLEDASLERTIEAHDSGVQAIVFDRSGTMFSTATDRTVKAWSAAGALLASGATRTPPTRLALAGAYAIAGGAAVEVLSAADGRSLAVIDAHTGFLNGLAATSDGKTLVTGGGDGAVRLWSIPDGALLQTIRAHPGVNGLDRMELSRDGQTLVSAGWNGTVKVWSLPDGRRRATFVDARDWLQSMALSPDARWLAEGLQDGQVLLRDLRGAP